VTVKAEKPAVVKYIALEEFLKATSFESKAKWKMSVNKLFSTSFGNYVMSLAT